MPTPGITLFAPANPLGAMTHPRILRERPSRKLFAMPTEAFPTAKMSGTLEKEYGNRRSTVRGLEASTAARYISTRTDLGLIKRPFTLDLFPAPRVNSKQDVLS